MDLAEVKLIASYKKVSSKIKYAKTIEDYWVTPYDGNDFDSLSTYVKKLEKYVPLLERAVNLRQQHYLLYIKDKKPEDLGHKFWRMELLKVVEDARKKLDYYQKLLNDAFDQLDQPEFYIPNLLIENVDEEEEEKDVIHPPEVSKKEKENRRQLRKEQERKKKQEEKDLLVKFMLRVNHEDEVGYRFISLEDSIKKGRTLNPWLLVVPEKSKGMNLSLSPKLLEKTFCGALNRQVSDRNVLNIVLVHGLYHAEIYQLCLKYPKAKYQIFDIAPMLDFEYIIKILDLKSNYELIYRYMELFNGKLLLLCISVINGLLTAEIDPVLLLPYTLQEIKAREYEYIKDFNDGFNKYCSSTNKSKARIKTMAEMCRKSFTYIIEYILMIFDKIANKETIDPCHHLRTPFMDYVTKNHIALFQ